MSEQTPAVHVLNKMANFFVLEEGQGLTLIDTGNKDKLENLRRKFEQLGLDLQALRRIVVTHSHYDHVGSLLALKQAVAAQVLAHRDEVPFLTQAKRIPRPAGVPGFLFWLSEPLFRAPAIAVDQVLLDGSLIEGTGLQVVHTPGHTPGHICLYHAGRKALFTGDGLVNNQGKLSGPVPFFSSDIKQARASLTRLAELDIETFYFAHGETLRGISKEILRSLAGLSIPVAVAGK
jgi:glyoxylase-like metal-dependent hydrolase (beta-lactamase superfamily II)